MEGKYSGGCLCGAIRYTTDADPVFAGNCHCKDCQKSSGSAFVGAMLFPAASVAIEGTPKYFRKTADSGNYHERGFCPQCGSTLFTRLQAVPGMIGIRAGSLDDAAKFVPALNFFTASAAPWDAMDPALPKRPRSVSA